jgi:hypothetical protein
MLAACHVQFQKETFLKFSVMQQCEIFDDGDVQRGQTAILNQIKTMRK